MNSSRASSKKESGQKIRIGSRLRAAAEYVAAIGVGKKDIVCADIGCDHGYLSIYLIEKGFCDKVYACDINEKPLNIARSNISARDTRGLYLSEKITVVKSDGLSELTDADINRVIICGMGGEVISGILERAKDFHRSGIRFILQPMSREMELRGWLCENGFEICDETLVRDAGRVYAVICAVFTGEKYEYSPAELILGRKNIEKNDELLPELCERKLLHARNLLRQGECTDLEKTLESELSELYAKIRK